MRLLKNKLFPFFWCLFSLMISNLCCDAQQNIKLNDIRKIDVIAKEGGFFARYFRSLEIIKEGNSWRCYQKEFHNVYDPKLHVAIDDTSRKFIKIIPERSLAKLISLINKRDSSIHLGLFNIDKNLLLKNIDSLDYKFGSKIFSLTSLQRSLFIKLLKSDSIINKTAIKVLHPRRMDDEDYYTIKLTDKTDSVFTIYARSFVYPYNLPWYIGNSVSYNPKITLLFEELMDSNEYEESERIFFHQEIDWRIYFDYLRKRRK